MSAYYNENDPKAAAWLRELIRAGLIAPGDVDERSIAEVRASELAGYKQCHFFAGIGGWSYALRLAGWDDARPVWTGSCPCQPFSDAGKGLGEKDARHLWPVWRDLIRECRPERIFGEQVASSKVIGVAKEGCRISKKVSSQKSCARPDETCSIQSEEEEDLFRPGQTSAENSGENQHGLLRNNGTAVQSGGRKDLGQSIDRSDRASGGLHLRQYQGGLPCCEQCLRRLGRGETIRNCPCHSRKEAQEIERIFEAARRELEEAVGCEWFARVRADLEAARYAVGGCDLPAAGVAAPHRRQRLYWVAVAGSCQRDTGSLRNSSSEAGDTQFSNGSAALSVGNANGAGCGEQCGTVAIPSEQLSVERGGDAGPVAEPDGGKSGNGELQRSGEQRQQPQDGGVMRVAYAEHYEGRPDESGRETEERITDRRIGAADWSRFDIIHCRDNKARRVEAGTFPLDHGLPGRVGLLRGYGNAIVPQVAAEFIQACEEAVTA